MPKKLEKDIQREILALLKHHGLWHWRNNVGIIRRVDRAGREHQYKAGTAGMPDITVVFRDGRIGWIEVKRPGGKMSEHQIVWRHTAMVHGHAHIVAESAQEVQTWLEKEKALQAA